MNDATWMRRALELAERGRGTVSPNPLVGCVLVRDDELLGEGWHEHAGGPHAEVAALRSAAAAGHDVRGATAYVTLEPCAHTGRTGPCADALLSAGLARVVVALEDPNPQAAGGAQRLRGGGVPVDIGVCEQEARAQNEVFLHVLASGRPFVVVKSAISLDGRIAAADGTSQWLTGPEARLRAHALRAEVDAVLVGSGTALADDPLLTCRLPGHDGPQPLRVVLDARGRIGAGLRVTDGSAPTLLVRRSPPGGGVGTQLPPNVQTCHVPGLSGGGVDLASVLSELADRGVRSLLVEGGASVASSFVRAGLADKLVIHVAPVLLGEGGRPLLVGPWAATLDDAPRLRVTGSELLGGDVVITAYPLAGPERGAARTREHQEA